MNTRRRNSSGRRSILIDARLIVEAVKKSGRDEFDEVAIALLVLAKQNEVVVAIGLVLDVAVDQFPEAFTLPT